MIEYIQLEEVEQGKIDDPAEAGTLTAVFNAMTIVHDGMKYKELAGRNGSERKDDGTLVTAYDKYSEQIAGLIMSDMMPDMRFRGEEGTRHGSGSLELGLDPLDGTRNFAAGGTDATVIATVYNQDHSIYGAAIGQPSTGRLYSSFGDRPTEGRLLHQPEGKLAETRMHVKNIKTWQGGFGDKGQVFIDNNQPFSRDGHVSLTAKQHIQLRADLQRVGAGVLELGSNGAHQLAIASGSEKAAVAITTARGVWEDTTAGLHLTERSGGAVQRYLAYNGVITAVKADELDYDMAIVANNYLNLRLIHELLVR